MEVKNLIRKLEDLRDVRMELKISEELARRDLEMFKKVEQCEARHNARLKQALQKVMVLKAKDEEKIKNLTAVRFGLRKDTLTNMLSFTQGQIDNYKRTQNIKKENWAKNLNVHINEYAKSRPLVKEFHDKEAILEQLQQQSRTIAMDLERCTKIYKDERQIDDILLRGNITEMATHVSRYYSVCDKLKNPNKPTLKRPHASLLAKMAMRNTQKPSSSVSEPSRIENNVDNSVLGTPATSECQQSVDTSEVADGRVFVRGSNLLSGFRAKKTDSLRAESRRDEGVNQEPSTMPKASTAKKPRNEIKNIDKLQATPKQSKQVVPIASSLKSSNCSQPKTKKGSVRFEKYPPPGSGVKVNVSSSGFSIETSSNGMDQQASLESEIEIPMNDGNGMDSPMDADEMDDDQMDDDETSEHNAIDDPISDCSSFDPSSGNNANSRTPSTEVSLIDVNIDEFAAEMDFFGGSHGNGKPLSSHNFDDFKGGDDDFDLSEPEDGNFFGNFN